MNHTRRELLRFLTSSFVAVAAQPKVSVAAGPRVRWAQGFLLWRNFKGQALTLQDALGDLRGVGADGIEFSPLANELEKYGLNEATCRQLMSERQLSLAGNYFSAPFYDPSKRSEILAEAERRFALLQAFNAKNVIIGPPSAPANSDRTQLIKQQAPLLNELGKRAKDRGLQIGVHPHLNTLVETAAEIDATMAATDPRYVGLSADTGHIHLAGFDVLTILRKHKTRLNYFHFKDGVRPFVRPDFKPNLRELGKGEVDFPAVMRLLKEIRFTGWVNIEQDATTLTPQESCRVSMDYVNKVLKPIYS